jgi:hypothetical protein
MQYTSYCTVRTLSKGLVDQFLLAQEPGAPDP